MLTVEDDEEWSSTEDIGEDEDSLRYILGCQCIKIRDIIKLYMCSVRGTLEQIVYQSIHGIVHMYVQCTKSIIILLHVIIIKKVPHNYSSLDLVAFVL